MGFTEETILETKNGKLTLKFYRGRKGHYCVCIVKKPWRKNPFVRIHSSCLFSESFGGNDCDCALQLQASLKIVGLEGGIIVYLFQEGRGLGLEGKIKALEIQRMHNVDTVTAFKKIGKPPDLRDYDLAFGAMRELGLPKNIAFATNNPEKIKAAEAAGFIIKKRPKLNIRTNKRVRQYLKMKQKVLDHHKHD